jgi:phosphatidate cytidylyltransferase
MAEARNHKSDLALRLLTAAFTAPLILYSLFAGPPWGFPCLAGFSAALAAHELFGMVTPAHLVLRVFGVVGTLAIFVAVAVPGLTAYLTAALIGVVMVGMLLSLVHPEPLEQATTRVAWAIAGPIYVGTLFGALAAIFAHKNGGAWVLLTLFFSFMSDTWGYFVGRAWGKHKLSPIVSPKKTVEGALGGLAGGLVFGLLMRAFLIPELSLFDAIALSLLATAAGQAGDLCESLIKRSAGVKDSGHILPGHGGILDRTDAMMFATPVVWAYVTFIAHLR